MVDIKAVRGVLGSDAEMHEPSQQVSFLEVSLVAEAPGLFLSIRGELDLSSVRELPRDAYSSREDLTTVLVDLGGLTFCDLTGLRALLTFRRIHEAQGRSVTVVRANPVICRLMRLCGITDWLEPTPAGTLV
jgi:anti-sigma B factor antagonist